MEFRSCCKGHVVFVWKEFIFIWTLHKPQKLYGIIPADTIELTFDLFSQNLQQRGFLPMKEEKYLNGDLFSETILF